MAGQPPWRARMVAGAVAVALPLACTAGDDRPGAAISASTPTTDPDAMALGSPPAADSPPDRDRPASFTAPIETQFRCDCPSRLLGGNGTDRAAILRSLPLPGGPPREEPSVQVLNRDGEIVWRFEDLELSSTQPAVAATSVLALDGAVVAPAGAGSLVGLDWSDGSQLWEFAGVEAAPRRVPGHPGLFTVADDGVEVHGGTSYRTHPRVWLREASSGDALWTARNVDDFTVADDGSRLLAVRFGDDAAELIRVELPAGSARSATVPGWHARGTSLVLNEDGTISSDIGSERHTVRVDWSKPEPTVDELGTEAAGGQVDRPAGPPGVEVIAAHDPTGTSLAAALDEEGRPATVFASDADGALLWERAAAEVASWKPQKGGGVAFKNLSVHDGADGEPVVLLELRRGFDRLRGAAEGAGPAVRVYDLRTGTDLWEWGRHAHSGGQTVLAERGLVLVAEAGVLDETGAVAEPGPLRAALLDLRTGAAEWDLRSGQASSAGVAADGPFAFVTVRDGPWLLSTARN